jgi:hypothetical protein
MKYSLTKPPQFTADTSGFMSGNRITFSSLSLNDTGKENVEKQIQSFAANGKAIGENINAHAKKTQCIGQILMCAQKLSAQNIQK